MGKALPKHYFSIGEKISIVWVTLFTAAAFFSQLLILQGRQVVAIPEQAYLPPFKSFEHLLGTDQLGRDVLFYLFLSCRTAWLLAIPPLVLASGIGIIAGTGTAILGNTGVKIPVNRLLAVFSVLAACLYWYPAVQWLSPFWLSSFLQWFYCGSAVLLTYVILTKKLPSGLPGQNSMLTIAVDEGLQKIINIWSTLPKLLLLLVLTAFTPFSMFSLMGWICATYWVFPARVSRAGTLQLKKEAYYESAQALGIPFRRVFTHFIWPSLKGPLLTNFCFAVSGLLGIGSTLAYLGIGLPADVPSWGKMLANARFSIEAWWLIVFPAVFLLGSIFSFQVLGNKFSAPK